MSSATIIVRQKDALVPEDFFKLAVEKNTAYFSAAFIDDDNTMTIDAISKHDAGDLKDGQELLKDRQSIFYLAGNDVPEESLQPQFLLKNDKDEPILVAFLDGDFSNYADEKSANSNEFHAVNKYLRPKVEKWYKKGGLENVLEELDDATTKEDIRNSFMGRGAIVFFAVTGQIICIQAKNPDFYEAAGWFTTNALGYKAQAQTSVPTTGKKQLFGNKTKPINTEAVNDRVSSKSEAVQPTAPKPEEPAAPSDPGKEQKETATPGDGQAATPIAESDTVVMGWKPDWSMFGKNVQRNQKIKSYQGCPFYDLWKTQNTIKKVDAGGVILPEGYKNQVPLFAAVPKADRTKYLEQGCYLKDAPGKVIANGKKEQGYPERENIKPKDTTVHNQAIVENSLPVAKEEGAGYKPFGDADTKPVKEWFAEAVKNKFISVGSAEIALDPAKIQSLEKPIPSPLEAAGMELADFFRISRPGHVDLATKFPVWYAAVVCEFLPKLVKAGILTKPTATKPAEEVAKAEEKAPITPPAEEAPKKKSLFGRKVA